MQLLVFTSLPMFIHFRCVRVCVGCCAEYSSSTRRCCTMHWSFAEEVGGFDERGGGLCSRRITGLHVSIRHGVSVLAVWPLSVQKNRNQKKLLPTAHYESPCRLWNLSPLRMSTLSVGLARTGEQSTPPQRFCFMVRHVLMWFLWSLSQTATVKAIYQGQHQSCGHGQRTQDARKCGTNRPAWPTVSSCSCAEIVSAVTTRCLWCVCTIFGWVFKIFAWLGRFNRCAPVKVGGVKHI